MLRVKVEQQSIVSRVKAENLDDIRSVRYCSLYHNHVSLGALIASETEIDDFVDVEAEVDLVRGIFGVEFGLDERVAVWKFSRVVYRINLVSATIDDRSKEAFVSLSSCSRGLQG